MIIFDKELERFFFFSLAGGYKEQRFKDDTCGTTLPVFFLLCCLGRLTQETWMRLNVLCLVRATSRSKCVSWHGLMLPRVQWSIRRSSVQRLVWRLGVWHSQRHFCWITEQNPPFLSHFIQQKVLLLPHGCRSTSKCLGEAVNTRTHTQIWKPHAMKK